MEESISSYYAKFVEQLDYKKIPEEVISIAKTYILDSLGVMLGATVTTIGKKIKEYIESLGGKEEASIFGSNVKTCCPNAALANGSFSEILEMQDGYRFGGNHPCSTVIPAAFSIGEALGLTGKDVIVAIVAGYEVENRIAAAIHPTHTLKGFLPTGTVGAFGAAIAAGKLLGYDEGKIINALGITGFILPLSMVENLLLGCNIKPLHGGMAARAGVEAALLANADFRGTSTVLEGADPQKRGFFDMTATPQKIEKMVEDLGKKWLIKEVYLKPFSSCRHTHGAAEATLRLREEYNIKHSDVREVNVFTYSVASLLSRPTNTSSTFVNCQFSIPYVVGAILVDGEMSPKQLSEERISSPDIHKVAGKVKVKEDPKLTKIYPEKTATRVEIITYNGKKYSCEVNIPKGDPRRPLTNEEIINKFKKLTVNVVGKEKAEMITSYVAKLESLGNIRELIDLMKLE